MKLSVITPVYNRSDCIKACMESVSSQLPSVCEIEHIVVDDGSTDGTGDVVEAYASKHDHVKLIRFEKNRGTNAGRNAAVKAANGDYVMILDSDDKMLSGAIDAVVQAIKENSDFEYFMFVCDDRAEDNAALGSERTIVLQDFIQGKVNGDFVHVIPRHVIASLPFDEDLRIYEGSFFMRFYRAVGKIKFINKTIYHRDRNRTDHVTFTMHRTSKEVLRKVCQSNELFYSWFRDDYLETEAGSKRLEAILSDSFRNLVLLGDYNQARLISRRLKALGATPSPLYQMIAKAHCGSIAWFIGRQLMKIKHGVFVL